VALLMLDVVMPKLNGPDAFLKIRAMHPAVPALFTSGHSFETSGLSSLVEGGAEMLQKPYGMNALLLKVREILDRN
jgi:DNA-binding response OmpR family regulator